MTSIYMSRTHVGVSLRLCIYFPFSSLFLFPLRYLTWTAIYDVSVAARTRARRKKRGKMCRIEIDALGDRDSVVAVRRKLCIYACSRVTKLLSPTSCVSVSLCDFQRKKRTFFRRSFIRSFPFFIQQLRSRRLRRVELSASHRSFSPRRYIHTHPGKALIGFYIYLYTRRLLLLIISRSGLYLL